MIDTQKYPVEFSVGLYFEIRNSPLYGGEGSVGYASTKLDGLQCIESMCDEQVVNEINALADEVKVSPKDVTLISRKEYDKKDREDNE